MVTVDLVTGQRFPTSGAFKPDDDGVSVFRESVLDENGLGAADILKNPQNLVVRLPVSAVRQISPLDVEDDAWPPYVPDPSNRIYAAHALITGWQGLGKNPRRSRQRELARHPELEFVYG